MRNVLYICLGGLLVLFSVSDAATAAQSESPSVITQGASGLNGQATGQNKLAGANLTATKPDDVKTYGPVVTAYIQMGDPPAKGSDAAALAHLMSQLSSMVTPTKNAYANHSKSNDVDMSGLATSMHLSYHERCVEFVVVDCHRHMKYFAMDIAIDITVSGWCIWEAEGSRYLAFANEGTWADTQSDNAAYLKKIPVLNGNGVLNTTSTPIHGGYYDAYFESDVYSDLRERMNNTDGMPLYIGGHSIGGALATIAAYDMKLMQTLDRLPTRHIELITFSKPLMAGPKFAAAFMMLRIPNSRYVTATDFVPDVSTALGRPGGTPKAIGKLTGWLIETFLPDDWNTTIVIDYVLNGTNMTYDLFLNSSNKEAIADFTENLVNVELQKALGGFIDNPAHESWGSMRLACNGLATPEDSKVIGQRTDFLLCSNQAYYKSSLRRNAGKNSKLSGCTVWREGTTGESDFRVIDFCGVDEDLFIGEDDNTYDKWCTARDHFDSFGEFIYKRFLVWLSTIAAIHIVICLILGTYRQFVTRKEDTHVKFMDKCNFAYVSNSPYDYIVIRKADETIDHDDLAGAGHRDTKMKALTKQQRADEELLESRGFYRPRQALDNSLMGHAGEYFKLTIVSIFGEVKGVFNKDIQNAFEESRSTVREEPSGPGGQPEPGITASCGPAIVPSFFSLWLSKSLNVRASQTSAIAFALVHVTALFLAVILNSLTATPDDPYYKALLRWGMPWGSELWEALPDSSDDGFGGWVESMVPLITVKYIGYMLVVSLFYSFIGISVVATANNRLWVAVSFVLSFIMWLLWSANPTSLEDPDVVSEDEAPGLFIFHGILIIMPLFLAILISLGSFFLSYTSGDMARLAFQPWNSKAVLMHANKSMVQATKAGATRAKETIHTKLQLMWLGIIGWDYRHKRALPIELIAVRVTMFFFIILTVVLTVAANFHTIKKWTEFLDGTIIALSAMDEQNGAWMRLVSPDSTDFMRVYIIDPMRGPIRSFWWMQAGTILACFMVVLDICGGVIDMRRCYHALYDRLEREGPKAISQNVVCRHWPAQYYAYNMTWAVVGSGFYFFFLTFLFFFLHLMIAPFGGISKAIRTLLFTIMAPLIWEKIVMKGLLPICMELRIGWLQFALTGMAYPFTVPDGLGRIVNCVIHVVGTFFYPHSCSVSPLKEDQEITHHMFVSIVLMHYLAAQQAKEHGGSSNGHEHRADASHGGAVKTEHAVHAAPATATVIVDAAPVSSTTAV